MARRESGFARGISAPKAERGGRENEAINERLTAVGGELAATFDRVQGIDWGNVSPEQRERARLSVKEVLLHVLNLPAAVGGTAVGGVIAAIGLSETFSGDLFFGPLVMAFGAKIAKECIRSGAYSWNVLQGKE